METLTVPFTPDVPPHIPRSKYNVSPGLSGENAIRRRNAGQIPLSARILLTATAAGQTSIQEVISIHRLFVPRGLLL